MEVESGLITVRSSEQRHHPRACFQFPVLLGLKLCCVLVAYVELFKRVELCTGFEFGLFLNRSSSVEVQ